MIPQPAITQWSEFFPWKNNAQIEQDLVICRALVAIFSDPYLSSHLAFRGGTALHKLYLHPQPRYSEDIDLVQINAEPIAETIDRIRAVLSFLGRPKIKQKMHNNTMIFRFDSEIPPIIPIRLKVEINCREHFNVLGLTQCDFSVSNQWFSGNCAITTYHLEELLDTKLRALYQRRKGRDLFDLYKAVSTQNVSTEKIVQCYRKYMSFAVDKPPTAKEYLQNMELKMQDDEFLGDTLMLLRPDELYNQVEAWGSCEEHCG
ncbi:MAG: nucleotidyl transferase AbiEii/AbiGii toxin family protein [Fibromonadaceae bacterium]|jgi:predicted nucleotidyltransferase component of viral defense system|nr:nucleotidyl transferase AbiEii/AbiGii toxin family protein [Fibromonadaceae bacterium]